MPFYTGQILFFLSTTYMPDFRQRIDFRRKPATENDCVTPHHDRRRMLQLPSYKSLSVLDFVSSNPHNSHQIPADHLRFSSDQFLFGDFQVRLHHIHHQAQPPYCFCYQEVLYYFLHTTLKSPLLLPLAELFSLVSDHTSARQSDYSLSPSTP